MNEAFKMRFLYLAACAVLGSKLYREPYFFHLNGEKTMDDSWVFSSVTNKDDRDEDQCTLRFLLPRSLFLTNYLRADSDVLTLVP